MRISDWSSDVCSSDLDRHAVRRGPPGRTARTDPERHDHPRRSRTTSIPGGEGVVRRPGHGGRLERDPHATRPDGGVEGPRRDRKSVVEGKRVSVRVDLVGRRTMKKKKEKK